jgi:HlyD family secretion protein
MVESPASGRQPPVRNKFIFVLAAVGLLLGLGATWYFSLKHPPQPPAFMPASNPYAKGIYANGIVESYQASGENIAIYPDVSGSVAGTFVREGQEVRQGAALIAIDSSVQSQTVAQLKAQAEAAASVRAELKAQPRPETLQVARAQMEAAAAVLHQVQDQLAKQRRSYEIDPRSVSSDSLDNATNTVRVAEANLEVARRQYELIRAGAWSYEVQNQEKTAAAIEKQYEAADALLQKYTLRAPQDGVVMSINAAKGSYVSPQGTYGSYTQGLGPVVVMSSPQKYLGVRVYVDEILVDSLPDPAKLTAQMQIRGTQIKVPLEFMRLQPYVTPKIELSNQRAERVDLRVLPVIFRFTKPSDLKVYPGQLVDVYIGTNEP